MSLGIREKILGCTAKRYTEVDLDTLGTLRVQSLNELERREVATINRKAGEPSGVIMLVFTAVDDNGNRLFSMDDVKGLEQVDIRVIAQANEVISEHVFGEAETEDDAVKN